MSETSPPITLRDGRVVTIRPLAASDKQALLDFGHSLPEDDWRYLQNDLRASETVTWLVNASDGERWRQVVAASDDGTIAAYSSARLMPGWSSHVADLQLLVGQRWRNVGVGRSLARGLVDAARAMGAGKLQVSMIQEQRYGFEIFGRMGFAQEGTLLNHTRDRDGQRHHLVVMALHVEPRVE